MTNRVRQFVRLATVFAAGTLVSVEAQTGLKTPWGEPDLQGLWDTTPNQIPLQRPAKFKDQEFFTEAQVAELDKIRAGMPGNETRSVRGTEQDVAGAYNAVFTSRRPTGRRTSLIVDPPDGRIPPVTPEVQQRRAYVRAFQLALLEATETCKTKSRGCEGGKYTGVASPRRLEPPPVYMTGRVNRSDGPEDRGLSERCLTAQLPDFSGGVGKFPPILQSPQSVS